MTVVKKNKPARPSLYLRMVNRLHSVKIVDRSRLFLNSDSGTDETAAVV